MKNILLAALVFAGTTANAQVQLGANSGVIYRVKTENNGITQPSASMPFAALEGLINHKHWQFGIAVGYSHSSSESTLPAFGGRPWPTATHEYQAPLLLLANRVHHMHHVQWYYGLSAGIVFAATTTINAATGDVISPRHNGYSFISAGPRVGGTWFVAKHFGINGEIKANANMFPGTPVAYSNATITFGGGIRYRL